MTNCELVATCAFFNDRVASMPAMSDLMKSRWCRGDNRTCARHVVFKELGREAVPADLFPGELDRANVIVGKKAG